MYAEMETGGTALAFAHQSMAEANGVEMSPLSRSASAPPIQVCFVSEQPERDFAHAVAHGATEVRAVEEKPWGQRVGHLRDLNGAAVEICSPMGG
jgi:uncharacterized glyoxalase superfamily protein PhnB